MDADIVNESKIVDSWHRNAAPWAAAVRREEIESRKLITDQAIIDAILSRSPRSVLDIGCGEGWLARALNAQGIDVIGVDAVPALIEQAQRAGGGNFSVASYQQIAAAKLQVCMDVAVCNFALFGRQSVEDVFVSIPSLVSSPGAFIVQTLHPRIAVGDGPYKDGWRAGSWAGFNSEFTDPAPWYFRTLESWMRLFEEHDLQLLEVREPLLAKTRKPASVIFIAAIGR